MKKNVGCVDRGVRLIVAAIFVGLYFSGAVAGTLGVILLVLALVFTLTAFISFCPLYTILGFSTCGKGSCGSSCHSGDKAEAAPAEEEKSEE